MIYIYIHIYIYGDVYNMIRYISWDTPQLYVG